MFDLFRSKNSIRRPRGTERGRPEARDPKPQNHPTTTKKQQQPKQRDRQTHQKQQMPRQRPKQPNKTTTNAPTRAQQQRSNTHTPRPTSQRRQAPPKQPARPSPRIEGMRRLNTSRGKVHSPLPTRRSETQSQQAKTNKMLLNVEEDVISRKMGQYQSGPAAGGQCRY